MRYQITHRTSYRYDDEVSTSYGRIHLLPRDAPGQVCLASSTTVDPRASDTMEHRDFYGNRAVYFEIPSVHRHLTVTASSTVEVDGRQAHLCLLHDQPWEDVRAAAAADPERHETADFTLPGGLASPTPELAVYAAATFTPRRPVLEAVAELAERIHDDLAYAPGSTTVDTTAGEVLSLGSGVCQDFAHVAIACLRAVGLPARYVSGYLETDPPPGRPRLIGADVSHAWASLHVPGVGWVDLDPTNRQLVNDRYVTTAWGRDYRDVPPLKGVIFTDSTQHELEVSVDVVAAPGG